MTGAYLPFQPCICLKYLVVQAQLFSLTARLSCGIPYAQDLPAPSPGLPGQFSYHLYPRENPQCEQFRWYSFHESCGHWGTDHDLFSWLFLWSSCFSGCYSSSEHFGNFFVKSTGSTTKVAICGLSYFINIAGAEFITKQVAVRLLPFFVCLAQLFVKNVRFDQT